MIIKQKQKCLKTNVTNRCSLHQTNELAGMLWHLQSQHDAVKPDAENVINVVTEFTGFATKLSPRSSLIALLLSSIKHQHFENSINKQFMTLHASLFFVCFLCNFSLYCIHATILWWNRAIYIRFIFDLFSILYRRNSTYEVLIYAELSTLNDDNYKKIC